MVIFATEIVCYQPGLRVHVRSVSPDKYLYKYKEEVEYECKWGYKKTLKKNEFATCELEGWTPETLCGMSILHI